MIPRFIHANENWIITAQQLFNRIQELKTKDPLYLFSSRCKLFSEFNMTLFLDNLNAGIDFWFDYEDDECNVDISYTYINKIDIFINQSDIIMPDNYILRISNSHNPGYPMSVRPTLLDHNQELEFVFDVFNKLEMLA